MRNIVTNSTGKDTIMNKRHSQDGYVMLEPGADEMERLLVQEDIVNANMPLYPKGFKPDDRDVLDVACGPGGWALDFADKHHTSRVTGIDISEGMLSYAREQARDTFHLNNIRFLHMNIFEPLAFPDASFDFVNVRFVEGVLSRDSYPAFLHECFRILRPGGYFRITGGEVGITVDSPTSHRMKALIMQALWRGGKTFAETEFAAAPAVHKFVSDTGFVDVHASAYPMNYSAGQPLHDPMVEDFYMSLVKLKSYIVRETDISAEEYDQLLSETHDEMYDPNHLSMWIIISIKGRKPA